MKDDFVSGIVLSGNDGEQRLLEEIRYILAATSLVDTCQIAVNAMASLMEADQAVLWLRRQGRPKVEAVLGIFNVERNIDFSHWFEALARELQEKQQYDVDFIPENFESSYLQAERSIYLLSESLHAKLVDENGHLVGGLFVGRSYSFTKQEIKALELYAKVTTRICGTYQMNWLSGPKKLKLFFLNWPFLVLISLLGAAFIPVRQSAVGIAEITAREAKIGRAHV